MHILLFQLVNPSKLLISLYFLPPQSHTAGRNEFITEFRKEMFTNENDYEVQESDIKNEVYDYEQLTSVPSSQDFNIKSEVATAFEFDVCNKDESNNISSEFIQPEPSTGE